MSTATIPTAAGSATVPNEKPTHCRHCGLRLSTRQIERGALFCCSGCLRVYELITEGGLDRYYDLRRGTPVPAAESRERSFAWLEALLADIPRTDNGTVRLELDLQGVHCAACVWLLGELFARHDGGVDLRINPALGQVDMVWNLDREPPAAFLAEAETFGYRFGARRSLENSQSRGLLIRLGVTWALVTQVMMLSLPYYLGLSPQDGAIYPLLGRLNLVLSAIAVTVGGWPFLRAAALGLKRRVVHLDLPIAFGIVLAYAGSVYAYFRSGPEATYFDTVTVFVGLVLVGRWLQEAVLQKNRNGLLADGGIDDLFTRRFVDGRLESIPAAEVRRHDDLWIVPGDLLPVDGIVVGDAATVALDWISGESKPRRVEPGEQVPAGARNSGSTTLRTSAQQDFSESRLRTLLRPAPSKETAADSWWRRVAAGYVTAVFVLAALGFALWIGAGLEQALRVTVAVLVVTCPCALGLAVPLAQELIYLRLQRHGVFLREGSFLNRALKVKKIIFDKTGTVTLNRLVLDQPSRHALNALTANEHSVLLNLCGRSNHPVSLALADALNLAALSWEAEWNGSVTETPGAGLEGVLDGRRFRVGKPSFALPVTPIDSSPFDGATVFSVDGAAIAAFRFEEAIKEEAPQEIARLEQEGYEIYLASGDDGDRVGAVAQTLGVPAIRARGALSPEDKAAWIESLDDHDTLMIGDGINDAPGFSSAYAAATPAVDHPTLPARADFYFLGEGIGAVGAALGAARRLRQVVRGNFAAAIAYNAVALTFCYLGWVTPVVAAVLMPVSSVVIVSLTTYRLSERRFS